jgi:SAM-dependent methyltransferase
MKQATPNWFADDGYWEAMYPFMFSPLSFTQARDQLEQVMTLSGVRAGLALDLGCGPGRYAVPLAERGFTVTGVDRTQLYLDRARDYAQSRNATVEWVRDDIRSFMRNSTFDLAISMFTSFGYFETAAENERVLANIYASLKSGGVFIVEMMGKKS